VDQVLPKGTLIMIAPDHFFGKVVKVVLAQIKDDNRNVRKNCSQQDGKSRAGASYRVDQTKIDDRVTWGLHRCANYSRKRDKGECCARSTRSPVRLRKRCRGPLTEPAFADAVSNSA
jgi:hypothetical protein